MKKLLLAAFGLLTAACTFAAVPVNRYAKQVPMNDETCTRNNPGGQAGVNNRIWTNDTDPQIYQWCTSVSDGYNATDQTTLVGAFIRVPGDANQNQYFLRSDNREHYYLIYEVHNSDT